MQAALISIAKWIGLNIILPMIQKAAASYIKTRDKLTKLKKVKEENEAKMEAYEKSDESSAHDTFSKLP